MDWISDLEKAAWNFVIDELVWHLREGRFPVSIHRQFTPAKGIEFAFKDLPAAFFPIDGHALEDHWDEAVQILSGFPQLQTVDIRSGA
jgi:hypothetical protein